MILLGLAMVLGLSVQSHATLTNIGTATYNSSDYNLIYDDDFGIVWLDYSNTPNEWGNQVVWAAGLNNVDALTYNLNPGITMNWAGDWRLPTAMNQDESGRCGGYNCTGSEMGHLYYIELGNQQGNPPHNTSLFTNLVTYYFYWSGTEYAANPDCAWDFNFF